MNFVICIKNEGADPSLLKWKIYQSLPNSEDQAGGMIRVIDEEEEDYLYPMDFFSNIDLPESIAKAYVKEHKISA